MPTEGTHNPDVEYEPPSDIAWGPKGKEHMKTASDMEYEEKVRRVWRAHLFLFCSSSSLSADDSWGELHSLNEPSNRTVQSRSRHRSATCAHRVFSGRLVGVGEHFTLMRKTEGETLFSFFSLPPPPPSLLFINLSV